MCTCTTLLPNLYCSFRLGDEIYKVINFMEVTVPNMLPQAFRRYFQLKPVTVNNLINFLMPSPRLQARENVRSIPVWKNVYMTLAYLGTQASTHKCIHNLIFFKKIHYTARQLDSTWKSIIIS